MMLYEWDEEIARMPNRAECLQALKTLSNWEAFYKEFKGFGTFNLIPMLADKDSAREELEALTEKARRLKQQQEVANG